jgi:hypothetical protein
MDFHLITVNLNQLSHVDLVAKLGIWISWLGIGYLYYLIAAGLILKGNYLGIKLWYFWTVSAIVNALLKYTLMSPRPYWIDIQINALEQSTSFGMPSGHAQSAVGILLLLWHHPKGRIWGIIWVLLVMLARIIVGVHSLDQVLLGCGLGLLLLWYLENVQWRFSLRLQWLLLIGAILYGIYRIQFGAIGIQALSQQWVRSPQNIQASFKISSLFVPAGFLSGFLISQQLCFQAFFLDWRKALEVFFKGRWIWLFELCFLFFFAWLMKFLCHQALMALSIKIDWVLGLGDLLFTIYIGYYLGLKIKCSH